MKKYLIAFFLLSTLLASSVYASETLHSFFLRTLGYFPPMQERREVYTEVWPGEQYHGTAVQNTKFLQYLSTVQPNFNGETGEAPILSGTFQTPSTPAFYEDSLAS